MPPLPSTRRPTVAQTRHFSVPLRRFVALLLLLALTALPASAITEVKKSTLDAFDRYARLTEARIASEVADTQRFLWLDHVPEPRRSQLLADLRQGKLVIESLATRDAGKEILIPEGIVHHWMAVVFVPNIKMMDAAALTLDYDNHAYTFRPDVILSKIARRDGNRFNVNMRFKKKKVITVVIDTQQDVTFFPVNPTHAYLTARTTRVQEIENLGEKDEKFLPVGHDGGFMWRLNTYWRYLERDGGTYIQCESITLTRSIPLLFRSLITPYVESVPRESLAFTLTTTRDALLNGKSPRPTPSSSTN